MYYLSDINKLNDKDKELNLNDYYLFTKGFSEEECSRIIKENSDRLQVSKQEHTNQDKRNKSCTLGFVPDNFWIYDRLCEFAREANNNGWEFLINGISEEIELIKFSGETRDSEAPRIDIGKNFSPECKQYRKITFYVCLNEPTSYEGGQHLIHNYGTPVYAEKEIGTCLLFPSYMLNGVTPVEKGDKYCLRGYVYGPHFK